jgi:RNA polymerase sigma-70 factor (ECF subfamily)
MFFRNFNLALQRTYVLDSIMDCASETPHDAVDSLGADAHLMLCVKLGDSLALETLVKKHRRPITYFIYRMVKNWAIAEELTQEVFLKIYRYRANYEATAPFNKWLYRIAMHTGLNYIRSVRHEKDQTSLDQVTPRGKQRQVPDGTPGIEFKIIRQVRLDTVRQAIDDLPERQRVVVYMHKYREMEYTQIAEAMGCSTLAIKSLAFRAYSTLRVRLANVA